MLSQLTAATAALILGFTAPAVAAKVPSSSCPYNYPVELNTTDSSNGLVFTIASNSPITNNRAVQLRTNPNFDGGFYVGIDAKSPVLLANFEHGAWAAQYRDISNQLQPLGPTGYLNLRDATPLHPNKPNSPKTNRFTVGFANSTIWPHHVDKNWYGLAPTGDGTYGLYHKEKNGVANGFLLCEADHDLENGEWYQLFYETYKQAPVEFKECESVGLRFTQGATIYNGDCEIGGYTA